MTDELTGKAAPPMTNGELDFEAPWQGRVFAMAKQLSDAGVFEWHEFQAALIREIEQHGDGDGPYQYFDRFQCALEGLLAAKEVVGGATLDSRAAAYAARPHGHDH